METAKLFKDGCSQAVRLPKEFWLPGDEVYIRREGSSVILTPKQTGWEPLIKSLGMFSDDFMLERDQPEEQERDFGWE